ncbi:MAG: hypothetical protein ABL995_16745 [Bryobacteraceae bacterium]
MNLTPIILLWAVLGLATLGLALYRIFVTHDEQDVVHLGAGEERAIPQQVALAKRLTAVDKWGKTLTVITVLLGLMLACGYLYNGWNDPGSAPNNFYRRNTQ